MQAYPKSSAGGNIEKILQLLQRSENRERRGQRIYPRPRLQKVVPASYRGSTMQIMIIEILAASETISRLRKTESTTFVTYREFMGKLFCLHEIATAAKITGPE